MDWMRLALNLAQQGQCSCPPNPMVGCVIIKNNALIGRGFHKQTGGPHAEVIALTQAGSSAQGADVYVTLEPCSHHGRTPPCVEALIQAKVRAVHIAVADPNPLVQGRGIEKLRRNGIIVHVGHCQDEAYMLNIPFFHYITQKRPFVVAKWAMTLDGKMATATGQSKWITSEAARSHANSLRAQMSAIMVGASTLRCDNPRLNVRSEAQVEHSQISQAMHKRQAVRQPKPIIVTASGDLPWESDIFKAEQKPLIICGHATLPANLRQMDKLQIEYQLFSLREHRFSMPEVLQFLATKGLSPILVEGGSCLLTSLFRANCVNELYTYIAPKIMGGGGSITPIGGEDILSMDQLQQLHGQKAIFLGPDICLISKTQQTAESYHDFLKRKAHV